MEIQLMSPRHLKVTNWIVLAGLVALGWLWRGEKFALGILVGGLLTVLNFHAMAYILNAVLNRPPTLHPDTPIFSGPAFVLMVLKYILRFLALTLTLYFLVKNEWVDVFGLLVGLATVVLTLILVGINEFRKIYFKEALAVNGTSDSLS
jgi:hypothetical protein